MSDIVSKREANRRIVKAEDLLMHAADLTVNAMAALSVIQTGLNQNYAKLMVLKDKLKEQAYSLRDCRETGLCRVDETVLRAAINRRTRGRAL
jgi:hypothetical protein